MGQARIADHEERPERSRRHPPEVRRRMIIEAAREVIARRGMAGTRMRELAAAADVSLGTLTYHFDGMEQVLAGVLQADEADFFAPLVETALAAETGREGLRRIVDGLFNDDPGTREHWLLWLDFWTLASRDATYGRWQTASYDAWRGTVTELVARGETDGSLTVADRDLSVSHFMALVDGVAAQAYLVGRESTVVPETPQALMWRLVTRLFDVPAEVPADVPAGTPRPLSVVPRAEADLPETTP